MSKQSLQNLPIGVSTWPTIRRQNMFLIDKTDRLNVLVTEQIKIFISRPRRMGKSLLHSMLADLFAHGDRNFEGFAIYGHWPEQRTYPVIKFSFMDVEGKDVATYENQLRISLKMAYVAAGFTQIIDLEKEARSFDEFLKMVAVSFQDHDLVFLIDEWDQGLSANLNNEEAYNAVLGVLSKFNKWLRGLPNVRFLLVTGIMRYKETSLFTGQDTQDISMEPRWASLLGVTQEELETCYAPYITKAAQRLDVSEAKLLEQLKAYYDGFCFDSEAKVHLYCPDALNKFFVPIVNDSQQLPQFESYWMKAASASDALKNYLRSIRFDFGAEYQQLQDNNVILSKNDLTSSVGWSQVKLLPVMAQSGYLTIKEATTDPLTGDAAFRLGYPNLDVSKEFIKVLNELVQERIKAQGNGASELKSKLAQALDYNQFDQACKHLNELLADRILYDVFSNASEAFYRTVFSMWFQELYKDVRQETHNYRGRSDIELTTHQGQVIVIELKLIPKNGHRDYTLAETSEWLIQNLLLPANLQICNNGYGVNYHNEGKAVLGVVIVLDAKEHRIVAWREFNPDPTIGVRDGIVPPVNLKNKLVTKKPTIKKRP